MQLDLRTSARGEGADALALQGEDRGTTVSHTGTRTCVEGRPILRPTCGKSMSIARAALGAR